MYLHFIQMSLIFVAKGLNRWQPIIWTYDSSFHWRIYALLGLDDKRKNGEAAPMATLKFFDKSILIMEMVTFNGWNIMLGNEIGMYALWMVIKTIQLSYTSGFLNCPVKRPHVCVNVSGNVHICVSFSTEKNHMRQPQTMFTHQWRKLTPNPSMNKKLRAQ